MVSSKLSSWLVSSGSVVVRLAHLVEAERMGEETNMKDDMVDKTASGT